MNATRNVALLTKGFDQGELHRHFVKHVQRRTNIAAPDENTYEAMADHFLGGTRKPSTLECQRSGGDTIRFDCKTEEYGIRDANGFIRTYFRPDPMVHGLSSNFHYMCQECRTVFLIGGRKQII
jgi:filamentous hemagglutinin